MALTGGRIAASIYQVGPALGNMTDMKFPGAVTGRLYNFPVVGVEFYPIPGGGTVIAGNSANTVLQTVIEVLPTGLRTGSSFFLTDATVATLVTNGS